MYKNHRGYLTSDIKMIRHDHLAEWMKGEAKSSFGTWKFIRQDRECEILFVKRVLAVLANLRGIFQGFTYVWSYRVVAYYI